jgi:hypothetical protein
LNASVFLDKIRVRTIIKGQKTVKHENIPDQALTFDYENYREYFDEDGFKQLLAVISTKRAKFFFELLC